VKKCRICSPEASKSFRTRSIALRRGGYTHGDLTAAVAARAIAENNMYNTRTTSSRPRANRRTRSLRCRGWVRPWRLGLSKVVDVVSNTNDALGTTVGSKFNGKYSVVRATARQAIDLFEDAGLLCPCCGSGPYLWRAA